LYAIKYVPTSSGFVVAATEKILLI